LTADFHSGIIALVRVRSCRLLIQQRTAVVLDTKKAQNFVLSIHLFAVSLRLNAPIKNYETASIPPAMVCNDNAVILETTDLTR